MRKFVLLGAAAAAMVPGLASAEFVVTDATAAITAGGVAVATIGLAALVMVVGIKVWKRLRGAA